MITSTGNQQIRHVIQLQKKAALRKKEDVFIAEGRKMCAEAEAARIVQAFASESFLQKKEQAALIEEKRAAGVPVEIVNDHVMGAMSDTKTPQGVLCVIRQRHYTLSDMLSAKAPRLMLLEEVRDPGNLGTILRAGEGAGVSGVLLSSGCVDIYNPKTIRSTMGSVYRVPFLYIEDMDVLFAALHAKHLPVYAAALASDAAKNFSYETVDYRDGCVFAVGNEANGLTPEMLARADACVHIPMEGQVESLNAAVAASLLMYEAYRQTRTGKIV